MWIINPYTQDIRITNPNGRSVLCGFFVSFVLKNSFRGGHGCYRLVLNDVSEIFPYIGLLIKRFCAGWDA